MNELYFGTGASSCKEYEGLYQVLHAAVKHGIRHFDTAPSYRTERILGEIIKTLATEFGLEREEYFIQTKIDPWQMQEGSIQNFAEAVMEQMGVDYLDFLLVHWPVPDYMDATWREMEKLCHRGIVKQIGVCNVRCRQLEAMRRYDVPPQLVQIERNPLRTCEREIAWCREREIAVQAYSPLCKMDERIRNNTVLLELSEKYGKSVGQVVLRWHLDTGVSPIFTSKKPERVAEYTKLYDFSLTKEEIEAVSALNENYKMYLESCICPGF